MGCQCTGGVSAPSPPPWDRPAGTQLGWGGYSSVGGGVEASCLIWEGNWAGREKGSDSHISQDRQEGWTRGLETGLTSMGCAAFQGPLLAVGRPGGTGSYSFPEAKCPQAPLLRPSSGRLESNFRGRVRSEVSPGNQSFLSGVHALPPGRPMV